MPDIKPDLIDKLTEYLETAQGREVSLQDVRAFLGIAPGSTDDTNLRVAMSTTLVKRKVVSPSGRKDGIYKVIKRVSPIQVFKQDRLRRPPIELWFPRNFTTDMELDFAEYITLREGDLISIGGVKSTGKTNLALGFCAENIDNHPVLMGNEYTVAVDGIYEPAPRFLKRLDLMSEWCEWTDDAGQDKFTLLPVDQDYAEHVIAGRINIIDWISLDANRLYDIGEVLKHIKSANGRGITIAILQKGEGAINPRGGQFVRDYSDLEILLDPFGNNPYDVLLTVKGAKETTKPIVGKTYAYTIGENGTKIFNFREVRKCNGCSGTGKFKGSNCDRCLGTGWQEKH